MYELHGEGIKLVYDRPKGTLDIIGDEPLLTREALETVESAAGREGFNWQRHCWMPAAADTASS